MNNKSEQMIIKLLYSAKKKKNISAKNLKNKKFMKQKTWSKSKIMAVLLQNFTTTTKNLLEQLIIVS